MSAVAALRNARALVERGWTRDYYARDKSGRRVYVASPSAVRWCPLGAIHVSTKDEPFAVYYDARDTLKAAIGAPYIPEWNDAPGRKKAEVLAAFDLAIEIAERGETL